MLLIVANSLAPFVYESVQILGLPDGLYFRARFPTRWIDPSLADMPEELIGREAIYALRTWEDGSILPLRRIRITNVKLAGDVLFHTYELGRLLSYSSLKSERSKQLDFCSQSIDTRLSEIKDGRNNAKSEMYPLVFDIDEKQLLDDFLVRTTRPRTLKRTG